MFNVMKILICSLLLLISTVATLFGQVSPSFKKNTLFTQMDWRGQNLNTEAYNFNAFTYYPIRYDRIIWQKGIVRISAEVGFRYQRVDNLLDNQYQTLDGKLIFVVPIGQEPKFDTLNTRRASIYMKSRAIGVPLHINLLLGKKTHFFEVGLGTESMFFIDRTHIYADLYTLEGEFVGQRTYEKQTEKWTLRGLFSRIAYRRQPENGGLMIRAGLSMQTERVPVPVGFDRFKNVYSHLIGFSVAAGWVF